MMTITQAGKLTKEEIARWFKVPNALLQDAPPPAAPRTWSILLTSANHGTVGPLGSTFSHAGDKHERVQVMEIVEAGAAPAPGVDLAGLVRITIDGTVIPLAAPSAPVGASTVLTDERKLRDFIVQWSAALYPNPDELMTAIKANIGQSVAAQAGQVVVPEELQRVIAFLMGEADLEGVSFGERHPTKAGVFWWRLNLRAAMHKLAGARG